MLIAEDELYRLPAHFLRPRPMNVQVCLWQHHFSKEELLDYARIHQPGLAEDIAATLAPKQVKRLIERLSVGLLLTKVFRPDTRTAYSGNGRPYVVQGGDDAVEISISHSGDIYALSLSRQRHGMDVEQWRDKAFAVRKHFLNADELDVLPRLAERLGSEERAATLLWSAKESLYKAMDRPGLDFRQDLLLRPHPTEPRIEAYVKPLQTRCHIAYRPYPTCILTYTEPFPRGSVSLT